MSRLVRVVVVGDNGYGEYGVKVNEYGGPTQYTDRNGEAKLLLEGSSTTIFVNGFSAYRGSVGSLPNVLTVDKCGRGV